MAEENREEYEEYVTFHTTDSQGNDLELALVDEFAYEGKSYVVGALIEGDTIKEDGLFIYRAKETEDGLEVEKITNHVDYENIAKAYMELDAES